MKFATTLLFATLLCSSAFANYPVKLLGDDDNKPEPVRPVNPTNNTWDGQAIMNWYISGSRGLWVGFVGGVYNVPHANISDHCLNKETTARIYKIMDAFLTLRLSDLFHTILDSAQIINNINECEIESVILALENHCETNDCSPEKVFNNVLSKIFSIIDQVNKIGENYQEDPFETDDEINTECEAIGQAIGSIIRMILDIQYL